jgi:hypothetical protein
MYFLPRKRPLELTAKSVRALRPSLNTPVVAAAELPVGPASGAILVHVEAGHGLQITVGVRSLGTGSVALYGFDGPISASVANVALDSALSFAESLGFLFDDDVVDDDDGSREKAVLRWQELIGDGAPLRRAATQAEAAPEDLFEPDGGELTDPTPEEQEASEPVRDGAAFETSEPGPPPAVAAFRPAPEEAELALSKFRVQAASDPGAALEAAARRARKRPVARLQLVKRRLGEPVQDARRAWLLRLLTSF